MMCNLYSDIDIDRLYLEGYVHCNGLAKLTKSALSGCELWNFIVANAQPLPLGLPKAVDEAQVVFEAAWNGPHEPSDSLEYITV